MQDPSFEQSFFSGTPWSPYSSTYTAPSPLCRTDVCGNGNGTAGPRTGSIWVWFGGVPDKTEYGEVSQSVVIPQSCSATLQFYLWIGFTEAGSGQDDYVKAFVDGSNVFTANATHKSQYPSYKLVTLDVSSFADGGSHTVKFQSTTSTQLVTFNLDDVSLVVGNCNVISGTVGANGATLSYTDGAPQTALALGGAGSYKISVSKNWSGTVTPTHPCYTFNPPSMSYSAVNSNFTGQNYTATYNNAPECKVTVGVFRPSNGVIFLKNANTSGYADLSLNYGMGGDYPIVGDWNNDGTDTIGVYRNGTFLLRNSNTVGFADIMFAFGQAGDQPVAGDWDGNGTVTVGVYRPSTGAFYLRNTNSAGAPDLSFYLGNKGDVGIAGDWDGDGTDTTGVFRPSNGVIFLKNKNESGFADVALNYGLAGDKPVVGDWDGNGTTTIGIMRGNRFYLRNSNTNGFANITLDLGIPGDMPIAGNWDGKP